LDDWQKRVITVLSWDTLSHTYDFGFATSEDHTELVLGCKVLVQQKFEKDLFDHYSSEHIHIIRKNIWYVLICITKVMIRQFNGRIAEWLSEDASSIRSNLMILLKKVWLVWKGAHNADQSHAYA
jgi:hypothetical protein